MKNKLIALLIIFITVSSGASFVSAQNETEIITTNSTEEEERIGESVKSNEDGYLNISFDDGYNGYCINKGWNGACKGDTFTVQNTSSAKNNNDGEEIGNYLKILFVDKYDLVAKNSKATQNILWSFSDNYNRPEYGDIVEEVRNIAASGRLIPDHGATLKINNTTEAVFDFEVLNSGSYGYQNFFGYKITYKDIISEIVNSTSAENITEIIKNETEENVSSDAETPEENIIEENVSNALETLEENISLNETSAAEKNSTNLKENNSSTIFNDNASELKAAGNPVLILLFAIAMAGILKFKK